MCIKILRSHGEFEFEPTEPLEYQIRGAKQVVIDYDPSDSRIECFMAEMDRIVKTGVSCQMNIKVNSNNYIKGHQFKKKIEDASKKLDLNEVVKIIVNTHADADRKLSEMSEMCLGRIDER